MCILFCASSSDHLWTATFLNSHCICITVIQVLYQHQKRFNNTISIHPTSYRVWVSAQYLHQERPSVWLLLYQHQHSICTVSASAASILQATSYYISIRTVSASAASICISISTVSASGASIRPGKNRQETRSVISTHLQQQHSVSREHYQHQQRPYIWASLFTSYELQETTHYWEIIHKTLFWHGLVFLRDLSSGDLLYNCSEPFHCFTHLQRSVSLFFTARLCFTHLQCTVSLFRPPPNRRQSANFKTNHKTNQPGTKQRWAVSKLEISSLASSSPTSLKPLKMCYLKLTTYTHWPTQIWSKLRF